MHEEIYAVRSTEAANLSPSQGVGLTKTAGEAALDAFMREGWFVKSRAGFITLTPRGLLELRGYLLAMFNDEGEEGDARNDKIKSCHVCSEIVTQVSTTILDCSKLTTGFSMRIVALSYEVP